MSKAPVLDREVREEAERRLAAAELKKGLRRTFAPSDPTRMSGHGEPIRVWSRGSTRLLYDGGGLCSPGLWPPTQRYSWDKSDIFTKALLTEFEVIGGDAVLDILRRLIGGRTEADPFPREGTVRLRRLLESIADPTMLREASRGEPQLRLISVRLLGALLHAFDDTDADGRPSARVGCAGRGGGHQAQGTCCLPREGQMEHQGAMCSGR